MSCQLIFFQIPLHTNNGVGYLIGFREDERDVLVSRIIGGATSCSGACLQILLDMLLVVFRFTLAGRLVAF